MATVKRYLLLTISFIILSDCQKAKAQKIRAGIYKLDSKIDTQLLNTRFREIHYLNFANCKTEHIEHLFSNLIDTAYQIRYAVVVSANSEFGGLVYKVILLNKPLSDYTKYVSYSDKIARKYLHLSLKLDTANGNRSWYSDGRLREFHTLDYEFNQFAKSDYGERLEKNKDYNVQYDMHNFFASPDTFILKSHHVKIITDSAIYQKRDDTVYNDKLPACFYKTEQQTATFTLQQAKQYKDILPIQKGVVFYTKNDKIKLYAGDFIALMAEENEWYEGDYIKPNGEVLKGKIFIDSLVSGLGKIQYLHNLKVVIFYTPNDPDLYSNNYGLINSIKTYNREGKLIQVLKYPGSFTNEANVVAYADVNFDSYKDLVIFSHDGGAGPNFGNNYYIYNPKTKTFAFNEKLSDLSQPFIDEKNKLIYAAWRDGAANHGNEKYKWIKGKLKLVEYYETRYLDEDKVEETYRILINGKMKGKTRIVKEKQLKTKF